MYLSREQFPCMPATTTIYGLHIVSCAYRKAVAESYSALDQCTQYLEERIDGTRRIIDLMSIGMPTLCGTLRSSVQMVI